MLIHLQPSRANRVVAIPGTACPFHRCQAKPLPASQFYHEPSLAFFQWLPCMTDPILVRLLRGFKVTQVMLGLAQGSWD